MGNYYATASASRPDNFELVIPGPDYGGKNLYLNTLLGDNELMGHGIPPDAHFFGSFLAVFDYTPPVQGVPEPTSLALLAVGLAGLAAVRRRAD